MLHRGLPDADRLGFGVADRDLDAEREFDVGDVAADGVAVALEHLDLVLHHVDRAHRVPHVCIARDGTKRLLLAAAADQDRQPCLDGPRVMAQVLEPVVAARLGGDGLTIEHAPHRADRFIEPVEPLAEPRPELDAVGVVLGLHPCPADTEDRPAVADVVERRGGLGDETWVPERVGADEQAEAGRLRLAGLGVEQRPALEDRLIWVAEDRIQVIPGPQVRIAQAIDPLRGIKELRPGRGRCQSTIPASHRTLVAALPGGIRRTRSVGRGAYGRVRVKP